MLKTEFKLQFNAVESGKKTVAIIVAAGSASRMGGVDKQMLKLQDTPVIVHSLRAFDNLGFIDGIIIVTKKDGVLNIQNLVSEYKISKVTDIVEGGSSRAQSVINGITACGDDVGLVLIHDGARPLVTEKIITDVKNAAELYGAATCAVPQKDTIKIIDSTGRIVATPKREELVSVQTPQGFRFSTIRKAIAEFGGNYQDITDDCSFVELNGGTVYTVSGSYENIKITTVEDIPIAEQILKNRGNK